MRILSIASCLVLAAACSDGGSGTASDSGSNVVHDFAGVVLDLSGGPSGDGTVEQLCVDTINMYRATLGLAAYARWNDGETCADGEAQSDSVSMQAHGAFGTCGEFAQDECPNWPAPPETMITGCLKQMWDEGPGSDFATHGHYINMSSTMYTKAACGFHVINGTTVWATQNFK